MLAKGKEISGSLGTCKKDDFFFFLNNDSEKVENSWGPPHSENLGFLCHPDDGRDFLLSEYSWLHPA